MNRSYSFYCFLFILAYNKGYIEIVRSVNGTDIIPKSGPNVLFDGKKIGQHVNEIIF